MTQAPDPTPSRPASPSEERLSELLAAWGGASPTIEERLSRRFGPESLGRVQLEREEVTAEQVFAELFESLRLRGGAFGRYRVKGEVGRGGMGVVLRVWDGELKRHLAMKLSLIPERPGDALHQARSVGRFLEEAQVTAQLDHPGIVPVHELGLDSEGRVYFTMRLVKGRSLAEVLDLARDGRGGWNLTRVLGVLLKACEALAFAHDKGVIHRDLKPANIMVGAFGEVYVMDWGLAKVIGRPDVQSPPEGASSDQIVSDLRRAATPDSPLMTEQGRVLGTPAYMPPEQARGDVAAVGPHSDVYSMGAILYQLLAGAPPYSDTNQRLGPQELLARVIDGPPHPIDVRSLRRPAELVAICTKAMARQPQRRYPNMLHLAEDLRSFLENRVVKAHHTGPVAELRKWVSRNRGFAAAASALLIVVAGGLAGFSSVRAANSERLAGELLLKERERAVANELVGWFDVVLASAVSKKFTPEERPERIAGLARQVARAPDLDDSRRALLLGTIGRSLRDMGQPALALEFLSTALEALRRLPERDWGSEFMTLNFLGLTANELRNDEQALSFQEEAVELLRQEGKEWEDAAIQIYSNMVRTYTSMNRLAEAEAWQARVDEWLDHNQGWDTESAAARFHNQARIDRLRGDFEGALESQRAAAELALQVFGPKRAETLDVLNNLASLLTEMGRREEALDTIDDVISKAEAAFQPGDPALLTSYEIKANLLSQVGRLDEAESLVRGLLEVRRDKFGSESDATFKAEANLASILIRADRWEESVPLLEHALQGLDRLGLAGSRQGLSTALLYGRVLARQQRHDEAREQFEQVADAVDPDLIKGDPLALTAWEEIARVELSRGNLEAAEAAAIKAVNATPPESPSSAGRKELLESVRARFTPKESP